MTKIERILEKIAKGEPVIGTVVNLCDISVTELMGNCGVDLLWIDHEHTQLDKKGVYGHIIAAGATPAASIVRVAWNDPVLVKPFLDMGVDGVIFPMVKNAEEAKLAVAACTYPPEGIRGYGPQRAINYGNISMTDYVHNMSKKIWKIMQIEHVDAVKNLDAILSVDGVDAIIVGANDLSGSIGLLGQTDHPDVLALMDEIGRVARKHGKPFGSSMGTGNPQAIRQWIGRGINWIVLDGDLQYLFSGCKSMVKAAKGYFEENGG